MIRSELVQIIAKKNGGQNAGLTHSDIEKIVAVFFDTISAAMAHNDRVEIRGFGTFATRSRKARVGRNPRTGAMVDVSSKRVPYFRCGKHLGERINQSA